MDIGFQYAKTKVTGSLVFKHNSYVLNLAPYKNILDNLKSEYTQIKENSSLYTDDSVNNYYKAVCDILDFDIKDLLSKMTLNNYFIFDNEIAEIATKVKTVVENYNSAKKLNLKPEIDYSTYNATKEQCDKIIENQSKNNEYDESSFAEFKKIYDDVIVKAENVETQKALDNLTAQLITAQTMLRKKESVVEFYSLSDAETEEKLIKTDTVKYGTQLKLEAPSNGESVKAWVVITDEGETVTKVKTTDKNFSLYVTKKAKVVVYTVSNPSTESAKYSKVVFCGFNGKVIDVKYLKEGEKLDSSRYTSAPEVPFYQFKSWDTELVTGTGNDIYVRANYTVKSENDLCTVYYGGFEGGSKKCRYDSYVSLVGATDDKCYALATKPEGGDSILTYLNRNGFYAPRLKEIYVVEVKKEDRKAKVAITGSFAEDVVENGATKASAVFNCKLYLPADCELIEWGAEISANGRTKNVKGESLSSHNEYTIRMKVTKPSSVKAFTGRAYVTYRTSDGTVKTIYSEAVEQLLN